VQEKTYAEDGKVLTLKITSQPAPVTTKSGRPLEGVSLVLDAGHGGSDPGAQRGDAQEKEMTLGIVNQLKKRLEANGAFITMTRSDDTFVSLEDRVKVTNLVMPKAFVSVHINALESTSDIKGIETYFQTEQSRPLAEAIHNSLFTSLGVPNRGIRKARFYVINHTSVPAILAEVGYISNKDEREKLISSDYQGKVADALAQGVILYVGKSPEMPESTVRTAPAINANQRLERGTSAGPAKSVAASLSGSGASAKQ
jgi:N-acetylmuramoyl-L-alanine amidase